MSSPYQNQTVVVVHNNVNVNVNNNNNEDRTVKTQHKKKKNIRYTGTTRMLFLTIVVAVAVTVMISARKVVQPTLFGSLTNTNVRTSTSTAIMSSEDDDEDDETWYDTTEEKEEAGQHDDSDSDTDSNTSDRFDPHEYPPVQQFTPQKEATGGYGNTVTVTKKNTKKKCPACYFPTSTIVGTVCQQLCHDTQQEQTHAVRKGRGWNFLGTNQVQDNWCAGTYLSTKEVQVGKDKFTMACIFKTGDNGGSIFDKSY